MFLYVPVMADSVGRIGQGQCLNSPPFSVPDHQLLQHLGTAFKVSTLRCESHALAIFGIPRISENIHNLRPLGIHKLRSIEKIFGHFESLSVKKNSNRTSLVWLDYFSPYLLCMSLNKMVLSPLLRFKCAEGTAYTPQKTTTRSSSSKVNEMDRLVSCLNVSLKECMDDTSKWGFPTMGIPPNW